MSVILKSIALIIVYLAVAKIGLEFGVINHSATIFWPPGGVALAAVLLGGARYLPAVFIAACLASVMVNAPFIFGLGSAIGNVLETYLGYVLLKRAVTFNRKFDHISDLITFFVLGAMIPAIASATIGPLSLLASGMINTDLLASIMWRWWRADVLGIVFFTPLILVFTIKSPFFRNSARVIEMAALLIVAITVGHIVFFEWSPVFVFDQTPSIAWLFPIIMWAGFRTGKRNAALIQLLFLSQALASAYFKIGIFGDDFNNYGLSNFWAFAMLLASVGMGLAIIATSERYSARKHKLHAKLFEISHDGVLITDKKNNIVSVNAAFTDITGYTAEDVIGKNPSLLSSGKQSQEFYTTMWEEINEQGHWKGELWNRRKDGAIYLERLIIHTNTDENDIVVSHIGNFSDITLQNASQKAIAHQAQHDFLTDLPNRLLFCDRFEQQLAVAKRHDSKFAIIYLDLDKFKSVNDTLGHYVGDKLLVITAQRLSELVREIDTVSRFGGDEFAILVSEVDTINDVTTLANKVAHVLSQPFILDKHSISISASIGVALYPEHGADLVSLMNNADAAMYKAKQGGDNNYVIAESN